MFRKILNIVVWVLLLAYLGVSLSFTEGKLHHQTIRALRVDVSDSLMLGFITWEDIHELLKKKGLQVVGRPIDSINRIEIREAVLSMHEIRDAQVFNTPDGTLFIRIWQKEPVARFIGPGTSWYLDEKGEMLSLSEKYSADVLMITGKTNPETARSLFPMIDFIRRDPFLRVMIQGIHVDDQKNLELITRIGNMRVFFGKADDYPWKFTKLQAFYHQGLPIVGWDKYASIDLRYEKQIVAKRRDTINKQLTLKWQGEN